MTTHPQSRSYSRRSAGLLLLVGVLAGVTVGGGVGVGPAVSPGSADSNPEKMSSTVLLAREVISAAPACGAAEISMASTKRIESGVR